MNEPTFYRIDKDRREVFDGEYLAEDPNSTAGWIGVLTPVEPDAVIHGPDGTEHGVVIYNDEGREFDALRMLPKNRWWVGGDDDAV